MQINIEKDKNKRTPHLAICHKDQGGSANNRHVSLLMKSDSVELTEDIIKAINKFGVSNFPEEIQKAMSIKNKQMLLASALKENFADDDEYLYVEDFTDNTVIFCVCGDSYELYSVSYQFDEVAAKVTVGETASPVVQISDYILIDGKLKLSEDAEHKLESGMYEIIAKSIDKPDTQEKLIKSYNKYKESLEASVVSESETNKTKLENKLAINQDILKSSEVQALIAAEIEKATKHQNERIEQLEKAKEKAEEERQALIKAQEEAEKANMLEVFKGYSFVTEEEAVSLTESLFKSEAAVLVMNTLEKAKEAMSAVAEKEAGVEAEVQVNTDLEKSKSRVAEILKSRKSKK